MSNDPDGNNEKDPNDAVDGAPPASVAAYRYPPVATRFKKGASGNPLGRPRKSERGWHQRQMDIDVLEETNAPVTIMKNGKKEQIPMVQLVVRQLAALAAKGNVKAIKIFFEIHQNALKGRAQSNPMLTGVVEMYEEKAIRFGHNPPDHFVFKDRDKWRKRSRQK